MECVVISVNILKPEIYFTILLTGNRYRLNYKCQRANKIYSGCLF